MVSKIEKLDYEGRGLTHINGKVFFVPRALPEEELHISVIKEEKHYSVAKIDSFIKKSEKRIPSYCPYAKECGGCTFDFVSYQNSLQYKKEILLDLFKKNELEFSHFEITPSRPVLEYRNKVKLHVYQNQFGYYKENSHEFVPIKKCALLNPNITALLNDFSLFSFSQGSLMIRVNAKEEILISIETEEELKIREILIEKHKIEGIIYNGKCVYGKSYLLEERGGIEYQVPASAFFQINPYISECIVKDLILFLKPNSILLDLYCGVGFFSFRFSPYVKKVIGIELNLEAILAAKENAMRNKILNTSFHVGKVEDILEKIPDHPDQVIVDPPRSGLHKNVIQTFLNQKIQNIIYISCNPVTLARDLNLLKKEYKIVLLKGYDMFSFTKHVECVCVLNRR